MIQRLAILASEVFGRSVLISGTEDAPVPDAVPPLTSEELATFAELAVFARSGIDGITYAEWQALDAAMAEDRALRQLTRAQFLAQTTAQKERQVFDVLTAHSKMIRALTRDKR